MLRKHTEDMIQQMMEQANSPWASPVVLVAKKDGTKRFCVDYRHLNSITRMDTFPLPRVDDSLDLLANTAYFTTLNLMSGYWQLSVYGRRIATKDSILFTFWIIRIHSYAVWPCNAPAMSQRLMEMVLMGLARDKCFVYLDDILVVGKTFAEHISN